MNSDAKIIILYLESLPAAQLPRALGPLWDFARDAGIEPGPYQKAKKFLKREGYLHEWRYRRTGGRWATAQILSNAPSTRRQAEEYWERCGEYADLDGEELDEASEHAVYVASPQVAPSDHFPAAGVPGPPSAGGSLPDVNTLRNSPLLPTRRQRTSKTERKAHGSAFGNFSQFADEEGEGFWAGPPEWLTDLEPESAVEPGDREEWGVRQNDPGVWGPSVTAPVPPAPEVVPVSVAAPVPAPSPPAPVVAPAPVTATAAEPEQKPVAEWGFEEVEAERVLLSLRQASRKLDLGMAEARQLVGPAAEWIRRGVSAAELKRAMVSLLPERVHYPLGFVRKRLETKMPAPLDYLTPRRGAAAEGVPNAPDARDQDVRDQGVRDQGVRDQGVRDQGVRDRDARDRGAEEKPPYEPPLPFVTCEGPGDEHVFRAVSGQVLCGQCQSAEAYAKWAASEEARARARGEDGLKGDGRGGWRDVLAGAAPRPGSECDPAEEAAAYAALLHQAVV